MRTKNLHTTLAILSAGPALCCLAAAAQAEARFPVGAFQVEAKGVVRDTTLRLRLSRALGERGRVDKPLPVRSAVAALEAGRPLMSIELPREFVAQLAAEGSDAHERALSGEQRYESGSARAPRGFDQADDGGWQLGAELTSPPFGQWGRLALFVDRGADARLPGLPGLPAEKAREVTANWGLGWRYGRAGFSAVIDWAQVLDGNPDRAGGDSKFRIQATLRF